MKPEKRAKELGVTVLGMATAWGCGRRNIQSMFHDRRHQFEIVAAGTRAMIEKEQKHER